MMSTRPEQNGEPAVQRGALLGLTVALVTVLLMLASIALL